MELEWEFRRGMSSGNAFPPLMEVPHVHLGLSVVISATKALEKPFRLAKFSSCLGACVTARSAWDLRTSSRYVGRSTRLLGPKGG